MSNSDSGKLHKEAGKYLEENQIFREIFDENESVTLKKKPVSSIYEGQETVIPAGALDPIYESKARLLNAAIQEIGMGKYQWHLFLVLGYAWASDSMWPTATSLILTPISKEFNVDQPPLLTLTQCIGLLVGALFWGFGCDLFGRKLGFNFTIGSTSIFALIAAGSPNFAFLGVFVSLWSSGVGGGLPIDSAIFLEFLPGSHQYLLTILSVFWSLGQLIITLVAWPLLSNISCPSSATTCSKKENFGWRWILIIFGSLSFLMFLLRFFVFKLYESPKYLMGKGKDAEAVIIIHEIARYNGVSSSLKLEHLEAISVNKDPEVLLSPSPVKTAVFRSMEKFNFQHLRALFATPKVAFSTSIIVIIWALIGLGYPLYNSFIPFIQNQKGIDFGDGSNYLTYRNTLIIAAVSLPGALIGAFFVQQPQVGRKGSLAISSFLTGASLLASTTAKDSNALLGWNCAFGLTSSFMYAVLYSYTPEIFCTKDRGTGNAITASANRIFGIMAPIVAMTTDLKTSVPVYLSGALFFGAGLLTLPLPFESRGKASL
ncbi:major facilitator superfamily domain-containing protein [Phakopsora pachyrhizi]|uniref:Major facilitator superfamily domain-containing protein n=1 Tax=Phakopsora pachyrhizi TaxID=170000 RepID=A0AAV0ANT8_PHAPC|nr:major facilitator superfamily domain-containing protein [Phakopsora pachyrhizi]CAH7668874.1 major facilitator superfamily domain-containing protein [Phakopsora pachyrhizi]